MSNPISPIHPSMYGAQRVPLGMSKITLPPDIKASAVNIAVSIFTDAVNVGSTFQDALLAIYLSGLENGKEASRDNLCAVNPT